MHRTTTTATLLVTVAVTALSGCVTVQRPPVPGSPTAPSRPSRPSEPSLPRPDGHGEPQVVQAPAREALELAGRRSPSAAPPPSSAQHGPAAESGPAARDASAASPDAPGARQPGRPGSIPRSGDRHHPHRPPHPQHPPHPDAPGVTVPDVSGAVGGSPDVCALGRTYGGWPADSPQAAVCEQAYGR